MAATFLLLGAGTGLGLALVVFGLVPARPSLGAAIDTLYRPPAPVLPRRQRLLEALAGPLRRLGLPRPRVREDLAALGLLAPAAVVAGANLMGVRIGYTAPLWLGLILAAAGFLIVDMEVRDDAEER